MNEKKNPGELRIVLTDCKIQLIGTPTFQNPTYHDYGLELNLVKSWNPSQKNKTKPKV